MALVVISVRYSGHLGVGCARPYIAYYLSGLNVRIDPAEGWGGIRDGGAGGWRGVLAACGV